jgi:hypothetical protein
MLRSFLICRPTQCIETRTVKIGSSGELVDIVIGGFQNKEGVSCLAKQLFSKLVKLYVPSSYIMGFLTLMLRNKIIEELLPLKHYLSVLE